MEISETLSRVYKDSKQRIDPWDYAAMRQAMDILADALRDAVAEADKLEYQIGSATMRVMFRHDSVRIEELNRMASFEWSDWQAAAHKKLMGEE